MIENCNASSRQTENRHFLLIYNEERNQEMGKTIRKNAKYLNDLEKNVAAKEARHKTRMLPKASKGEEHLETKQNKLKLHGHMQQRHWPHVNEGKKGRQKI